MMRRGVLAIRHRDGQSLLRMLHGSCGGGEPAVCYSNSVDGSTATSNVGPLVRGAGRGYS
jgi:hypothetical protein